MEKLTEQQRKEIIQRYLLDNSKENIIRICNDYNISKQYIFKLAKSDRSKEAKMDIIEHKSEFTKTANKIIKMAFERLELKLQEDDKISAKDLGTLIGILYDKSRLDANLSTENKSVQISIKIEK